jgi:transposase
VVVHPGDIQDRDGARLVLDRRTRCLFPFIERIFADAGYQGPRAERAAASTGRWVFEIVKRNELHKFVVLPKRWIVERTLAWISRNRRLARDFERYARTVAAFVRLARIRIMFDALPGQPIQVNCNFPDRSKAGLIRGLFIIPQQPLASGERLSRYRRSSSPQSRSTNDRVRLRHTSRSAILPYSATMAPIEIAL